MHNRKICATNYIQKGPEHKLHRKSIFIRNNVNEEGQKSKICLIENTFMGLKSVFYETEFWFWSIFIEIIANENCRSYILLYKQQLRYISEGQNKKRWLLFFFLITTTFYQYGHSARIKLILSVLLRSFIFQNIKIMCCKIFIFSINR